MDAQGISRQRGCDSVAQGIWAEIVVFLSTHRPYLSLILFSGLLYLPWLTSEPVRITLEANRLEAAREMLHSGDWVVPTLNGVPYLAKPPLQYWIIAAVSYPWGEVTVWLGRLPSALSVMGLVCLVAWWGRRELGAGTGYFAAVIVASSGLLLEKGVRAELEALLALGTTASLFGFWMALEAKTRRGPAMILAGVALAAAVLTKGPVAPVVFVATVLAILLNTNQERRRVLLLTARILGIAVLIVLPWGLTLLSRVGVERLIETLNGEVVRRIRSASETNIEPFWFYVPAVLGGLLPWTVLLPGLWFLRSPGQLRDVSERRHWFFLVGWSVGSLVLFSFSSGKEVRYLMPTYPAWALLVAWGWARKGETDWLMYYTRFLRVFVRWSTWVLPIGVLVGGLWMEPNAWPWVVGASLLLLTARIFAFWGLRVQHKGLIIAAILVAVVAAKAFWAEVYQAGRTRVFPVAQFGKDAAAHLRPGEKLIVLGKYRSYIQFAVNHPFVVMETLPSLKEAVVSGRLGGMHVLADTRVLPEGEEQGLQIILRQDIGSSTYRLLYIPECTGKMPE